jgi:hypothetical protein
MSSRGGKEVLLGDQVPAGVNSQAGTTQNREEMKREVLATRERSGLNSVRSLTATPAGGGDQGGLGERPTRPKPPGVVPSVPLLQHRAILGANMEPLADGNWDDSTEDMENLGF